MTQATTMLSNSQITRLPTRSFNLALEPILGFFLEQTCDSNPTNSPFVLLDQYPKMKVPSKHKTVQGQLKSKHKDPILDHSQYKSMTLRIYLLSNHDAGTCSYKKHHSPISKISLARSTQIKKYTRQSVSSRIFNAQSNNVRIQKVIQLVLYSYLLLY